MTSVPTELPTITATPEVVVAASLPASSSSDAITVLLLGLDARSGEGLMARSDAIVVARIDPDLQRVALLSLPRDLWVSIPGVGEGKINSAYFIGEQTQEGAALARDTVSQAIGVKIDHVAVIDFTGFRSLIDALGGVPVDVPKELYDPQFPTDDYGYTVAHFMPGTEVMNGDRALMFSRIRHPDSDFERMRRQQLVLLGIVRRLRQRGIIQNLHEADTITESIRPFIHSDISTKTILELLWSMRSFDPLRLSASPQTARF